MTDMGDIVARVSVDLQRAETAVAMHRNSLAAAEAEVTELRVFLKTLDRYRGTGGDGGTRQDQREQGANTPAKGIPRLGTMARQLVDTSIAAMREAGRPVPIGELLDHVLAAGLPVGGNDQKSNLAGYLSRDPRVKSLGRTLGWTTVEEEEAAPQPASEETASSIAEGGTDDRSTLAQPDFDDL